MAQYLARYKIKELELDVYPCLPIEYRFQSSSKQLALTHALKKEEELTDHYKKPVSLEELAELIPILR